MTQPTKILLTELEALFLQQAQAIRARNAEEAQATRKQGENLIAQANAIEARSAKDYQEAMAVLGRQRNLDPEAEIRVEVDEKGRVCLSVPDGGFFLPKRKDQKLDAPTIPDSTPKESTP